VRGETVPAARIDDLVAGLEAHGWLARCDAVLSGYLGAPEQARAVADAVRRVKAANGRAFYLCDPVFGDDDGAYARLGVAEAMARDLLPLADIVTPNRFELSSLTSKRIDDVTGAVAAARTLGVAEVVVTSVQFGAGEIGTVAVTRDGAWATSSARLDAVPHGSGDLFAALYLAARVRGEAAAEALARASSAVDFILRASAGADELRLIAEQRGLAEPTPQLVVRAV
jgi:pyridoxine kinase